MSPRVGIVGAGQLARMAQQAAIPLGIELAVLADSPDDSAAQVSASVVLGDYRSLEELRAFAKGCAAVTFDHELTDPDHLAALAAEGLVLRPGPVAKRFAQDKGHQRRELSVLGMPVPAFAEVGEVAEAEEFAAEHGWPIVLKAPRGGYDGRGVWVVGDAREAAMVLDLRPGGDAEAKSTTRMLAEEMVPLVRELAVMIARRPGGEVVAWPVVETVQVAGVLRESVYPPSVDADRMEEARQLGVRIAETIGLVGVMAVELFDTGEGPLLINELALRPHNSGHWTIEGATTSQFANHLRAVLDWPLGATTPMAPAAVTVNVLGRADGSDPADGLPDALAVPHVSVHLYGKDPRPGRKLGHVTALGHDVADARQRARRAAAALGEPLPEETT